MEPSACEAAVRAMLESNPTGAVSRLITAIATASQNPPPDNQVVVECAAVSHPDDERTRTARAYFSADALDDTNALPPTIVLLCDRLTNPTQVQEALTHELVHAYDHSVLRRDLRICEELACSEVRAYREAECSDKWDALCESLPGPLVAPLCARRKRSCAKNGSLRSTASVFGEERAAAAVERVFDECFAEPAEVKAPSASAAAT